MYPHMDTADIFSASPFLLKDSEIAFFLKRFNLLRLPFMFHMFQLLLVHTFPKKYRSLNKFKAYITSFLMRVMMNITNCLTFAQHIHVEVIGTQPLASEPTSLLPQVSPIVLAILIWALHKRTRISQNDW